MRPPSALRKRSLHPGSRAIDGSSSTGAWAVGDSRCKQGPRSPSRDGAGISKSSWELLGAITPSQLRVFGSSGRPETAAADEQDLGIRPRTDHGRADRSDPDIETEGQVFVYRVAGGKSRQPSQHAQAFADAGPAGPRPLVVLASLSPRGARESAQMAPGSGVSVVRCRLVARGGGGGEGWPLTICCGGAQYPHPPPHCPSSPTTFVSRALEFETISDGTPRNGGIAPHRPHRFGEKIAGGAALLQRREFQHFSTGPG